MNIWFVIWVFVATFILGTSFWSYTILLKQKRSWETVSKKLELRYLSEAILKSPTLSGVFKGFEVDVFSDQPISGKFREGGARTIFQFSLPAPLPSQGAIGSMVFKNFIDGMMINEKFVGEGATALLPEIYNKVRSKELMVPYFTKERVSALNAVLNIKNSPAIMIYSPDQTLLRIESSDPFDNPERMQKFMNKVADAAKILSI